MVHGNGGARSRFRLFEERIKEKEKERLDLYFPLLPGFEGRPLPAGADRWEPFISALSQELRGKEKEPWIYYGHGIGGSLLLEWASRGWKRPDGGSVLPRAVILHGSIGASLDKRLFPLLMKPVAVRRIIHWLIYQPWLQPFWERKLFQDASRIPRELRRQFFRDYERCEAFPVFFDLITPAWYERVKVDVGRMDFHFLWGDRERVVASRHLDSWKRDFPNATFEVVPGWDHFPMLDEPGAFCEKMITIVQNTDE